MSQQSETHLYIVEVTLFNCSTICETSPRNRAFSRDVTRTKLIKYGRHFGVQYRFLERLACLRMEPRSYIEALGAELVGKEDEWTN